MSKCMCFSIITPRGLTLVAAAMAATLLLGGHASAQDFNRIEVFGGYSILRPNLPSSLFVEPGVDEIGEFLLGNVLGWRGGLTYNLTRNLGIKADFGGHYRSLDVTAMGSSVAVSGDLHAFMFGPAFTFRQERVNPFVQVLVGFGRAAASGTADNVTVDAPSQTGFAGAFGGGVDIQVNERISVRAIELDYFPYRQGNGESFTFNNVRWGTGIVVGF